jgi:hypothetical protein
MTTVRIADSVISREIGGCLVVLDVNRGAYYQLDRTAAAVWRAIATSNCIDRIVDASASAFGHQSAAVERDVREFVANAVACGLLLQGSEATGARSSAPRGDRPVLSVDRSGIRIDGDVDELRDCFLERPFLALPGFVAPDLLSIIESAVERGDFADRAHPGIGAEGCLESGDATRACQLVFNDPALLDVVTRIAGCSPLRCFDGRVYRLESQSGHYDSWHSDAAHGRLVGLSVNLSREPYEGGVLEIRRARAAEAEHAVPSKGFGSAVLFRISPDLRHRVTAVRGGRPRTAYAGWFCTRPDFADVFLAAMHSRAGSVAP